MILEIEAFAQQLIDDGNTVSNAQATSCSGPASAPSIFGEIDIYFEGFGTVESM